MNEPNPIGRRRFAHEFPSIVSGPANLTPPVTVPSPPTYPHQLRGRPFRAHEIPSLPTPHLLITPVTPLVPVVGPSAAATFLLALEPGTKVTYSWSTSIVTSYSGAEQRESPFGQPRRRVDGTAFLLDGPDRDAKGSLMRSAARGSLFLVALPFEELAVTADSAGTVVTVDSTALCDWALPGQRAVVLAVDGVSKAIVVVQSKTATTITIATINASDNFTFGTLGTIGKAGARIMPLVAMLLDPQQGFSRYPVTADLWNLRALAAEFGFAGVDSMGIGTSIQTVNDGEYIPVAELTDDDLPIWDRPNFSAGASNEAMASRASVVDLGALAFGIGGADAPDWGRSILYTSSSLAEFAWLKAFLRRARGRQGAFLLSTNRPDFVFVSTTVGGFKITTEGDYASWFVSSAHRRLALTTSGGIVFATITAVADNGDGTLTLTTSAAIAGTVTKVSLLEQLRFASDDLAVTWDGGVFTFEEAVVTVQDAIAAPPRQAFVFDTTVSTGTLTFPITPPKQLSLLLGQTTMITYQSDRSLNVGSLTNSGPGGNVDGMVVCLVNINSNAFGMTLIHEDSNSTATSRFRNAGNVDDGTPALAAWYRYNGTVQRWIQFAVNIR